MHTIIYISLLYIITLNKINKKENYYTPKTYVTSLIILYAFINKW